MKKILALLLVLPLLLLTACDLGGKKIYTDYTQARIDFMGYQARVYEIDGYYYDTNNTIVLIIKDVNQETHVRVSMEHVLLIKVENNED